MQRLFSRLAIASGLTETVSEISHRTGMDIYVLKAHIDQMVEDGEVDLVREEGVERYRIKEGKEGDI
jgi:DNA-binding MarR family transcriptional regulator